MKKTIKRILWITLSVILIGGITFGAVAVFGSYSDGSRVGKIVKFSKKGYIFKTYEGQLNVGGFAKDSDGDISPNVWSFSVDRGNEEIREAIDHAMDKGLEVKLHYKEKFYQFDWRGETKYFINDVEIVEEEEDVEEPVKEEVQETPKVEEEKEVPEVKEVPAEAPADGNE